MEKTYFDGKIHRWKQHHSESTTAHQRRTAKTPYVYGAHENINLITLTMGASGDGLEILNKKGEWVAITALPEQVVVSVGDMLQRLTNNTPQKHGHRVR